MLTQSLSDEYISLPSGFLFAGSPSVVCSLWTVDDFSTTFLMIQFYENLLTGLSVAVALNSAQKWLRAVTVQELKQWTVEKNLPFNPTLKIEFMTRLNKLEVTTMPFQEPFYWAAFCAIGQ